VKNTFIVTLRGKLGNVGWIACFLSILYALISVFFTLAVNSSYCSTVVQLKYQHFMIKVIDIFMLVVVEVMLS
jgi:hypothetical protein